MGWKRFQATRRGKGGFSGPGNKLAQRTTPLRKANELSFRGAANELYGITDVNASSSISGWAGSLGGSSRTSNRYSLHRSGVNPAKIAPANESCIPFAQQIKIPKAAEVTCHFRGNNQRHSESCCPRSSSAALAFHRETRLPRQRALLASVNPASEE